MNQDDRQKGNPGSTSGGDANKPDQDRAWVGDQGLELHRLIARGRSSRSSKCFGKGEGGTDERNHDSQ